MDAEGNVVQGVNFYDEDLGPVDSGYTSGTPEFHVVQSGDTLWAISQVYLHDPYLWPKLWSYNQHVTNAHWIFPGDRIRLTDPLNPTGDLDAPIEGRESLHFTKTRVPVGLENQTYTLNQTAYVDAEQFELDMEIVGCAEAKVLMATLDTAYMDYEKKRPPIPGERLVVYTPQEEVRDIKKREVLGYLVQVVGEIEIEKVARKTAEGTIADAVNPVERGYKVGPLRRKFRDINPVEAERSEVGLIIATMNSTPPIGSLVKRKKKESKKPKKSGGKHSWYPISGEEQFVVVDMGGEDGVKVGNLLEVVRKGDEYTPKRAFKIPYEDGWPRRVTGSILVVQVEPKTSLGVVVFSRRELERGDHVELRGPGLDDDSDAGRSDLQAEGHVEGRAKDGKAEASGGFKLGK